MALVVVLLSLLAMYVACRRPAWTWTLFVWSGLIVEVLALKMHMDTSNIPLGPIMLRTQDAGSFGIFVGTLYHLHHQGYRSFRTKPFSSITATLLIYLGVKVLWTVLVGQDQINANPTASHAAGGTLAAVGELRDNL